MRMTRLGHVAMSLLAMLAAGCGSGPSDGQGAGGGSVQLGAGGGTFGVMAGGMVAMAGGTAAAAGGSVGGQAHMYPAWRLTDVQPRSPRANESYGLDAFLGRPVVAVLIEGF